MTTTTRDQEVTPTMGATRGARRAPLLGALSSSGKHQDRRPVSCDVVRPREASARCGDEGIGGGPGKSARPRVALVAGYGDWLVELTRLVGDTGVEAPPSGIAILESGTEL